jgi:hypothetical protein
MSIRKHKKSQHSPQMLGHKAFMLLTNGTQTDYILFNRKYFGFLLA